MKRPKYLALIAALCALALVAAACGGDEGEGDGNGEAQQDIECTWQIGTIGALSGDFATIGQPIFQGVEYGVDQLNEAGDLPCELELVEEDSQGDPNQAPQLARSLAEEENMVAIIGPYFSGESLAAGPIFTDAAIPWVTPSATNETIDDQGFDTFFRAVANDADQGPTAAEYITSALQPETVAVIHDNQDYSKGLADTVQSELGDVAEGPFIISPEETDYSAVVSKVQAADPDVVYYGGYSAQAGPLLKQLREAGVEAVFFSDDGTKDAAFGELAGKAAAEGALVTCPCADPLQLPAAEEFVSGIEEAYDRPPGTFAADAFDSVNLIAEALMDADPEADVEEIRQSVIETLHDLEGFEGIAKTYTFQDNGEVEIDPLADIWVYEWSNADEDFVSIGPAEEAISGG